MGEVRRHAEYTPACTWGTAILTLRSMVLLSVIYLVLSRVNDLTPVASKIIHWASAWNKPALRTVILAYFSWTRRSQAQQLWASVRALAHRHALCLHPVTILFFCCVWV